MIVLWCNGSTAVFGSACLGSNPGKTTIIKAVTKVSAFIVITLLKRIGEDLGSVEKRLIPH